MKLDDLITKYSPVFPEPYNWKTTLNYLLNDPVEKNILDTLVDILQNEGQFEKPVVYDDNYSAGDEKVTNTHFVVDGTHRVCAHILLGIENVNAIPEEKWKSNNYRYCLSSKLTFVKNFDEDKEDALIALLSSFPYYDNTWFNSDVSTITGGNVIVFMWEHAAPFTVDITKLEQKLKNLLKRENLLQFLSTIETTVEDLFDDEDNLDSLEYKIIDNS